MGETETLREPTWKEWLIIKNISLCKEFSPTYKKKWAERIGAISSDPTFARALNILKNAGIMKSSPWIANYNVIEFDIKKLDKFIEKTKIYKEFKQYVYGKELFVIGV